MASVLDGTRRATVAEVLELQLRLARERTDRLLRMTMVGTQAREVRDRLLDIRNAITPALDLLEEGRRLRDVIDPPTVETPVVLLCTCEYVDVSSAALGLHHAQRRGRSNPTCPYHGGASAAVSPR